MKREKEKENPYNYLGTPLVRASRGLGAYRTSSNGERKSQ